MNERERQLRSGYLSFSRADLAQSVAAGDVNADAYKLMIEATETNNSYTTNDGQTVNEIYPLSADAAEMMSQKLAEAAAAAGNPDDDTFRNRLKELQRVASWSKERHSIYSWLIIIGGILWMVFYGLTTVILAPPDYNRYQAQVEAWNDTPSSYTIDDVKEAKHRNVNLYSSADNYKLHNLREILKEYFTAEAESKRTASTLRYGTLSERDKEIYRHNMEVDAATMDKVKAEFEKANAQPSDYWQQKALEEIGGKVNNEQNRTFSLWLMVAYFLVITVLYVLTNNPYGYMLSRQRTTQRVSGGIVKALYAIIMWLGISGARMGWTDPDRIVTIFWSDGSVTKHLIMSDLINGSAMFKIIFYAAALTILMYGSAYLLPILTIIGYFTNVDRQR